MSKAGWCDGISRKYKEDRLLQVQGQPGLQYETQPQTNVNLMCKEMLNG